MERDQYPAGDGKYDEMGMYGVLKQWRPRLEPQDSLYRPCDLVLDVESLSDKHIPEKLGDRLVGTQLVGHKFIRGPKSGLWNQN